MCYTGFGQKYPKMLHFFPLQQTSFVTLQQYKWKYVCGFFVLCYYHDAYFKMLKIVFFLVVARLSIWFLTCE